MGVAAHRCQATRPTYLILPDGRATALLERGDPTPPGPRPQSHSAFLSTMSLRTGPCRLPCPNKSFLFALRASRQTAPRPRSPALTPRHLAQARVDTDPVCHQCRLLSTAPIAATDCPSLLHASSYRRGTITVALAVPSPPRHHHRRPCCRGCIRQGHRLSPTPSMTSSLSPPLAAVNAPLVSPRPLNPTHATLGGTRPIKTTRHSVWHPR